MTFLAKYLMLSVMLFEYNKGYCRTDNTRDRRFIILGDSNVGFALSFGGSIGSGIISSSKFKGRNFNIKRCKKKKHKYREYDDYGPGLWMPWWGPSPYY